MRQVNGNKKGFKRYIIRPRRTRENVGQLLTGAGEMETKDTETTEALSASFDSVFTGNTGFQESQVSETIWSVQSQEDLCQWRRTMSRHS